MIRYVFYSGILLFDGVVLYNLHTFATIDVVNYTI